jgi:hypothetical protein
MNNLVKHLAVEKLREALECHDWHYERSDDSSVYRRGRDESDNIRNLMNTIGDRDKAISMYNKHCPWIESKDEVTPISENRDAPTLEEKCISFLEERNYYISKQKS